MTTNLIDAHCHIYPPAISLRAVESVDAFYDHLPAEHYDGTVHSLLAAGRACGVSRFVVHSVATSPRQVHSINEFIARSVREADGAFIGLGTLHPGAEDIEADFRELLALGLHGVKLHPDIQRFEADQENAMRIYALCEACSLPVLVHTGDYRYDYSNPERIANILEAFPRLRLVGAHFGGWSVWDRAAEILPRYPNMMVDCSSSFHWLGPEKARSLIMAWGPERVMYGTDYPLWPMEPEIRTLQSLGLSAGDYEKIAFTNAQQLYDPKEDNSHG